jgi:hypothetical protein
MERKKSSRTKSQRRYKKKGGTQPVQIIEGPLDTAVHRYLQNDDIEAHVQEMGEKKSMFDQKFKEYKEEYDEKATYLNQERLIKDKDFRDKLEREEMKKMLNEVAEREISAKSTEMLGHVLGSAGSTAGNVVHDLGSMIQNIFKAVFHTSIAAGQTGAYGLDRLGLTAKFATTAVGNIAGKFMETAGTWFAKFFFQLIFAIAFFVFIILLIVYGVSILTKPKDSGEGAAGGGSSSSNGINAGCSSILTDSLNINLSGIKNFFNPERIQDEVEKRKQQLLQHKPKFDLTPDYDFSFKNPFEFMSSFSTAVSNNPTVKKTMRRVTSTVASTQENVSIFAGNGSGIVTSNRVKLPEGRTDNIILIDTNLIQNKRVLSQEIRPNSRNKVEASFIPKNIEWIMPEDTGTDYSKLPPELLKHENLKNKNKIIVPWKKAGNEYKLSCSDAYFDGTAIKADILTDSEDGKSCIFNKITPVFTDKEKYRCVQ